MASSGGVRAGKDELAAELAVLRKKAADPFQVLDVAPDAGERVIHAAFLQATKRLHPNRFAREAADVRELANEAFLIVRRAWSELEDDQKRKLWRDRAGKAVKIATGTYIPSRAQAPAPPMPTVAAHPAPQRSVTQPGPLGPAAPAPRAAGTAATLLEQVRARDLKTEEALLLLGAGKVAEARTILEHLVAEDGGARKARLYLHYARARIHREAGKTDDARKELERAIALDAKFEPAIAELRDLGDQRPAGFFSKLRGK